MTAYPATDTQHVVPFIRAGLRRDFSLLLVEDNDHHSEMIRVRLERAADVPIQFEHVTTLADALDRLGSRHVDAVLLDLALSDSPIDQTLAAVQSAFPALPIIVLTSLDDHDFAAATVKQGAQDFLVKTELSGELLLRSVRYAVERKYAETALRQYAADLEHSNEDLKQFAHTVAHEVKNPLSVVSNCLQVLEFDAERLGDVGREMLNEAATAVRNMAQLVDELLGFASVEQRSKSHERVDVEAVFEQALRNVRREIAAAGGVVTSDPLPVVIGDDVQLRLVMQNLLSNALKYRAERRPEVHVSASRAGDQQVITVRDNGIGIPAEHRIHIFDMFYRVNDGREAATGTGIGLAFCRRIIEQHNGRLWVDSEAGRGSTFSFSLPAADEIRQ